MNAASLRLEDITLTDVGAVRETNEDSLCARPDIGLWAVADGMGGHERGDWASAVITGSMDAIDGSTDFERTFAGVTGAIQQANSRIFAEAQAQGAQMGSTVVALLLAGRRFAVAWAGDSRAYLLRDGTLHQLTRDHSQVQELIDRGLLTPEQARNHPMGHVLARAVGVGDLLELDAVGDEMQPGDVFLLCSDGVHGVIEDSEIAAVLDPAAGSGGVRSLVEMVHSRGAPDNFTLIIVRASEPTLLVPGPPS